MKAVCDTSSSDCACVYEVSSNYPEWIKSYSPDKQKVTIFDLLALSNCDLGARVMKAVCNTPSSDCACVYEVSSNYLEWIKSYGPDKQKVTIFDL
jgi:hypothetical protein